MFNVLARSFHTATRLDPPRLNERPPQEPKRWNAPRHWLKPAATTKTPPRA